MNFQTMKSNWANFFRMAIGKHKQYPVKVMRSPEAKAYPLIEVKKDGDVGYDLVSLEELTIPAPTIRQRGRYLTALGEGNTDKAMSSLPKAMIPTGIHLEMQNNVWCSIEARSSASKKMIFLADAIIDAGYRGELFAVAYNFGFEPYKVQKGERIAQVIFHERVTAKIIEADTLSDSERGTSGFGSTGD
ncbi:deoxyuridine 5'-triphosphate nucleotidohydrolase [Bacillus phage vB_BpsS-140]|nr:deoxyuridine 5'-triphosphate nucleotidohydrolase [Bacillus phage vB_BpsS-140]